MDSEEFEQVPWSSLMTDKAQGVDPRVYAAVAVVGVVVAIVFGMRMFGGSGGQPDLVPVTAPAPAASAVETTTTAGLIVSEADLMAASGVPAEPETLRAVAYAEWFVTDFYTIDGSPETETSLRSMLSPSARNMTLPHSTGVQAGVTYVEWARAVAMTDLGTGEIAVDVIYRTITEADAGFVRDPIAAVVVTLRSGSPDDGVIGPPVPVPVPMPAAIGTTKDTEPPPGS